MKNLKLKTLVLGIASTVLISSNAFGATNNNRNVQVNKPVAAIKTKAFVNKPASAIKAEAFVKSAKTISPSFNYGPNGGPNIVTILNEGGVVQKDDVGYVVKEVQTALYYYFTRPGISQDEAMDALIFDVYSNKFIDGVDGVDTYTLVSIFQGDYNLKQDGVVGRETWNYLGQWDK